MDGRFTRFHAARLLFGAALFGLVSCSGVQTRPWVKNGERIGTIYIYEQVENVSYRWEYLDFEDRMLRFEQRGGNERLLPNTVIGLNAFDAADRLTETRFVDEGEQPAVHQNGAARIAHEYMLEDDAAPREVVTHYGLDGAPVTITEGYCKETVYYLPRAGPSERLKLGWREFLKADGSPGEARIGIVKDIYKIEYIYLEGVGEMLFATYFDRGEKVIHKELVRGITDFYQSVTTTTTYY